MRFYSQRLWPDAGHHWTRAAAVRGWHTHECGIRARQGKPRGHLV